MRQKTIILPHSRDGTVPVVKLSALLGDCYLREELGRNKLCVFHI